MPDSLKGLRETILVVDHHESVRMLIVDTLESAKFQVFSAGTADEAIRLADSTGGKIDLLLTDLEVPQMSGPDLGEHLKRSRPDIHVMLMAGGQEENRLVLNYGWSYIQKALLPGKLVEMVMDVLNESNRLRTVGSPTRL